MPYVSRSQQKFFHTAAGKRKIGARKVKQWDRETKNYKRLPARAKRRRLKRRATQRKR